MKAIVRRQGSIRGAEVGHSSAILCATRFQLLVFLARSFTTKNANRAKHTEEVQAISDVCLLSFCVFCGESSLVAARPRYALRDEAFPVLMLPVIRFWEWAIPQANARCSPRASLLLTSQTISLLSRMMVLAQGLTHRLHHIRFWVVGHSGEMNERLEYRLQAGCARRPKPA